MNGYITEVLQKKISAEREQFERIMVQGKCTTFDHYRHCAGILYGLDIALRVLEEVNDERDAEFDD